MSVLTSLLDGIFTEIILSDDMNIFLLPFFCG